MAEIKVKTENLEEVAEMLTKFKKKEVKLAINKNSSSQLTRGIRYIEDSGVATVFIDEEKVMNLLRSIYKLACMLQFVAGIVSYVALPILNALNKAREGLIGEVGKPDMAVSEEDQVQVARIYVNKATEDFVLAVVKAAGLEFEAFAKDSEFDEKDRACYFVKGKSSEIERFQGIAEEASLLKQA